MEMNVVFAGVPVRGFEAAVDWYSRLFDRKPDIVPHDTEVMWQVSESACLYVLEDSARAGNTVVSIAVADLDAAVSELAIRDIDSGFVEAIGDDARKATLIDPDGNRVALIEVNDAAPR